VSLGIEPEQLAVNVMTEPTKPGSDTIV